MNCGPGCCGTVRSANSFVHAGWREGWTGAGAKEGDRRPKQTSVACAHVTAALDAPDLSYDFGRVLGLTRKGGKRSVEDVMLSP